MNWPYSLTIIIINTILMKTLCIPLFFFLAGSFTIIISRTTAKAKFLVIKIWSLDPQDLEQSCPAESVKLGQHQKASRSLQRHSMKTKSNSLTSTLNSSVSKLVRTWRNIRPSLGLLKVMLQAHRTRLGSNPTSERSLNTNCGGCGFYGRFFLTHSMLWWLPPPSVHRSGRQASHWPTKLLIRGCQAQQKPGWLRDRSLLPGSSHRLVHVFCSSSRHRSHTGQNLLQSQRQHPGSNLPRLASGEILGLERCTSWFNFSRRSKTSLPLRWCCRLCRKEEPPHWSRGQPQELPRWWSGHCFEAGRSQPRKPIGTSGDMFLAWRQALDMAYF